tara:strand:+ start:669 stop:3713 length:3045 start_codon:yes stop_codon:yes gene_type:complete
MSKVSAESGFSKINPDENNSKVKLYMDKFYQFDLIGRTKLPSTQWNKDNSKEDYDYRTIRENIGNINKGIITGKWNDIFVLDIDMVVKPLKSKGKVIKEGYTHTMESHPFFVKFGSNILKKLNTYTTKTGNGGFHIYFKYDKSISKNTTNRALHTDIRSTGGYVVAPFSFLGGNAYEKKYELYNEENIITCPPDIKEWIINEVIGKTKKPNHPEKKSKKFKSVKNIPEEEEEEIIYGADLTQYSYTFTEKELRLVLDGLPKSYFQDYDKWLIFTTAMKQLYETESFDECDTHALWHEYSKKYSAGNYNEKKNNNNWDGIHDHKTLKCLWSLFNKSEYNGSENILQYTMMKEVNTNLTKPDEEVELEKLGYDFFDRYNTHEYGTNYKYKNAVVKSDTGTGKTTSFYSYVKEHHKDRGDWGTGFISLTSRISLAEEQYNIFNNNDLECRFYKHVDKDRPLDENESVVVQIDSIAKLSRGLFYGWYSDYIIYLDEFNSLVEYLITSPTLENKRIEVFYSLKELLVHAKQVIMTDADISDTSLQLLKIFDIPYEYIRNTYSHNKGVHAEEIFSRNHFLNKIKKEKKFLCCCDSKTEAEIIYNELKDEDAVLITSETDKLPNFDLHDRIIYSPKVIYGIDSTMKRPVYCFYKEHTISPTAMVQQIARCRNITKLHFHFKDKMVKDYDFSSIMECKEFLINKDDTIIKNSWCLEKKSDDYIDLLINFKYCRDAHDTNKFGHFIKIITDRGFIFNKQYKKNYKDTTGTKLKKENEKVKLERFNPKAEYVVKANEILRVPEEKIDEYKEIFIDTYKISTHLNIKDYFFEYNKDPDEAGYKFENELKNMGDWNMNKASNRRSHLNYLKELTLATNSKGFNPTEFNIDTPLTAEKKKYFSNLYDVIHPDKIDNPFNKKDIDINKVLVACYKETFGKEVFESKRRNIKQYNEDGSVKRKENGKLDYGKETYYQLNKKYLHKHDLLVDYSRKVSNRKYPDIHPEKEEMHKLEEFAILSSDEEDDDE